MPELTRSIRDAGNIPQETLDYLASKRRQEHPVLALLLVGLIVLAVVVAFLAWRYDGAPTENKSPTVPVAATAPAEPYNGVEILHKAKADFRANDDIGALEQLNKLNTLDLNKPEAQRLFIEVRARHEKT
jgi:hypothetical protein